jgi:hypothetical protein
VAQENEWQKKAGLPDSTTIGVGDRPNVNVCGERKVEDVRLVTARSGKAAWERVKSGREWSAGTQQHIVMRNVLP